MFSRETPDRLDDQVALVTGAGVRVGREIARALGARGAHVIVHYHRSREAAVVTCEQVRSAGGSASLLQADLADRSQAERLIEQAVAGTGRLDILIPSAASFERVPLDEIRERDWDRAMQLNATAPFFLAYHARTALRASQGTIVFITCASTATPFRDYLPYLVSKGAVRQVMRALALELAPDVRVNAVAPGTVLPPASMPPRDVERLSRSVPLQRIGSAEDVARAVLYLVTSPFVTGQEIYVDGGRSLANVAQFA